MNPNDCTKYPRSPHLPWSPGGTSDDARLIDTAHFEGREVVITEKMDGENTSMYRDAIHARSIDGRHHPSRDWVKALHGVIRNDLPDGWRFCGENVYAQHSIVYEELASYFYLFSIWDADNTALSWEATLEWADMLNLVTVPELYRGPWDETLTRELAESLDLDRQEGFVVRVANAFAFDDFGTSLAKWVRTGHVQTDQHWMFAEVVPNGLADTDAP
jgi:hypothetical protein